MNGGRVKRTYGKKMAAAISKAAVIFGASEVGGSHRDPLADITQSLNSVEIGLSKSQNGKKGPKSSNGAEKSGVSASKSSSSSRKKQHQSACNDKVEEQVEAVNVEAADEGTSYTPASEDVVPASEPKVNEEISLAGLAINTDKSDDEEPVRAVQKGKLRAVVTSVSSEESDVPNVIEPILKDQATVYGRRTKRKSNQHNQRNDSSKSIDSPDSISSAVDDLLDAYKLGIKEEWGLVLDGIASIEKIAEASYAEVYRISTPKDTSIIKVMRIRTEEDPDSLFCDSAMKFEDMISEIRIMQALDQHHGFLRLKAAKVITGKVTDAMLDACNEYLSYHHNYSSHPHPEDYSENSKFLVIELGDAGEVLENLLVDSTERVWDVIIGTVLSLACAEMALEFEVEIQMHPNRQWANISIAQRSTRKQHLLHNWPYCRGYPPPSSGTEIWPLGNQNYDHRLRPFQSKIGK